MLFIWHGCVTKPITNISCVSKHTMQNVKMRKNQFKWQTAQRCEEKKKIWKRFINRTTIGIQLKRISARFVCPKVFHLSRNTILFELMLARKLDREMESDLCVFRFTFSLVNPKKGINIKRKKKKNRGSNSGYVWMMTALNLVNSRKTYFLIINPSVINKHDRYLFYPVWYVRLPFRILFISLFVFFWWGLSSVSGYMKLLPLKMKRPTMLPNKDISAHLRIYRVDATYLSRICWWANS